MQLQTGPWGGGNQFATSLTAYLKNKGIAVVHDLTDKDIDIIVLTEPRKSSRSSAYTDKEITDYLRFRNPAALVVHRINECDERKGTDYVNKFLIEANRCADHTIFISTWLEKLFLSQGIASKSHSVIMNGADANIFNRNRFRPWDHQTPLRIVTHHWGESWLKGFDIYQQLDEMLEQPKWKGKIEFTYIGRVPEGFIFRNTHHVDPLSGKILADELRQHHLYVSASRNEPAGMHHIEGAMCGMPLLYIESGALPEYCQGYGVSFTEDTFAQKLETIIETYDDWYRKMPEYPHTAEKMCESYFTLFIELLRDKKTPLISLRTPAKKPGAMEMAVFQIKFWNRKIRQFKKKLRKIKKITTA